MLGLDVSKGSVAVCLVDDASRQVRWEGSVPNTPDGIAGLVARVAPSEPWVLEPTGSYSAPIVRQARAAGRAVLVAHPKAAKAFLTCLHPRAKTDRLDGRGLAQYALAVPLRPYPLPEPAQDELRQLLAARKGLSASRARLRQQARALPAAAEALKQAVADLSRQITTLDAQIAALAPQVSGELVDALLSIPGVGPVTAAAVGACLSSKDFGHPDQFVAYVGLDVRVRESGQRRGQGALSRNGDAELRRLFFVCAQANLRRKDAHNPFRDQYARERAKGLSSTAALHSVARKLARTAWSLARHRSTFDPDRVHQPPSRRRLTPTLDGPA